MYYILYGIFYLISLLPFWILYGISNFAFILIYYVICYRKEIVFSNLNQAFPDKTLAEKKVIAKQFYKNFADNFIEVIKLFSISPAQVEKRFTWDYESLNKYYAADKNVQLHMAHFFNWEYSNLSAGLVSKFPILVVYMPIANKAMDRVFIKLRTRFNSKMIAATSFLKDFKPYIKERYCIVFVGDQSAGNTLTAYWLPFFGKLTPFVTGPEKNARLTGAVCLYVKFSRIKRGYYHISVSEITDGSKRLPEGELTRRMIALIESNIREEPSDYLWTHRRWKHTFDATIHRAY